MTHDQTYISLLQERDMFYQHTEGVRDHFKKHESEHKPVIGYCGFDSTAKSYHVGNLIPILMLRRLQQCGHKPIVLMGGATTRLGDPSFKDETRKLLSEEEIEANSASLINTFARFIRFGDGKTDAVMVNNYDWFKDIKYLDILRDIGPHYSVNRMLAMEGVKSRLDREQSLSFLEFNYMILQGYDFYHLNKKMNCTLQIGGSDQWGNLLSGVELCRRKAGTEVHALTAPLLTTASGKKMGKTEAGAVWLHPDYLSPYDYWQFWRNCEDGDVIKFMKIFTDLPTSEIEDYAKLEGSKINEAKIRLANEATAMAHGEEESQKAHKTATETFKEGAASSGLPTFEVSLDSHDDISSIMMMADLCSSKSDVRRLIQGGGARMNDEPIKSHDQKITENDFIDGVLKLSAGKKKHALIKLRGKTTADQN